MDKDVKPTIIVCETYETLEDMEVGLEGYLMMEGGPEIKVRKRPYARASVSGYTLKDKVYEIFKDCTVRVREERMMEVPDVKNGEFFLLHTEEGPREMVMAPNVHVDGLVTLLESVSFEEVPRPEVELGSVDRGTIVRIEIGSHKYPFIVNDYPCVKGCSHSNVPLVPIGPYHGFMRPPAYTACEMLGSGTYDWNEMPTGTPMLMGPDLSQPIIKTGRHSYIMAKGALFHAPPSGPFVETGIKFTDYCAVERVER